MYQIPDGPPECPHDRKAVRVKTFSDGRPQYCYQCLDCGRRVGSWIGKTHPDVLALTERVPFDEAAEDAAREQVREFWENRRQERTAAYEAEAAARQAESIEWWARYNAYLTTPAWRARRELVIARAEGMCEGCRKRRATQVHHLTYDHVGNEFLWELVAICDTCHTRYHDKDANHAA